jgi:hypothetical protein
MKRALTLAIACAMLLVAVPAASAKATDGYGIKLTVDSVDAAKGTITFSFTPEGFSFKKVPYAGGKDQPGQGHVHIYALADGAKKAKYIGWSATGTKNQTTDKGMLKAGKSYRVFARFSFNDHRERKRIMSNWVRVTVQ